MGEKEDTRLQKKDAGAKRKRERDGIGKTETLRKKYMAEREKETTGKRGG